MTTLDIHDDPMIGCSLKSFDAGSIPSARMFRWTGPTTPALPVAGGDVDGVCTRATQLYHNPGPPSFDEDITGTVIPAVPGLRVKVEAGGAFSSGASLVTDSSGRAVTGSGKVVLRALEAASGAGAIVWAVFTSGR